MQYKTTRNDCELFNEKHALCDDIAPDGGFFVPSELPDFKREDILLLQHKSYGEIIANVLSRFFSIPLNGWDIDFSIGRNTARVVCPGSKTYIAEMWHNPAGTLQSATESLYQHIANPSQSRKPSLWFEIATKIAYLFALYGELNRSGVCIGGTQIDLSVDLEDMTVPIAALYAREMGLPIRTILIISNNNVVWDLIHRGEVNASGSSLSTIACIEHLIHRRLGYEATDRFVSSVKNKRTFFVEEDRASEFSNGLFCIVSGTNRYQQIMSSFVLTNKYVLDPSSAQCVNALQDYRAKTGVNNGTLIISTVTPLNYIADITAITGLCESSIIELVGRS